MWLTASANDQDIQIAQMNSWQPEISTQSSIN